MMKKCLLLITLPIMIFSFASLSMENEHHGFHELYHHHSDELNADHVHAVNSHHIHINAHHGHASHDAHFKAHHMHALHHTNADAHHEHADSHDAHTDAHHENADSHDAHTDAHHENAHSHHAHTDAHHEHAHSHHAHANLHHEHGSHDAHINAHNPTPSQPRGPFYPRPLPVEKDVDLTIKNNGPQALGLVVRVMGQVSDGEGHPIKNAKVEIWQASTYGSYDHPDDTNPAQRDPNFQNYGEANTDANGQYAFKTIVPGAYPTGNDWNRPPHIHYQVTAPGYKTLVTQLYFDGNSFEGAVSELSGSSINGQDINNLNQRDHLINRLTTEQRANLIVHFNDNDGIKQGIFDIYLQRK
ncbi:MAG TPA: hypothetical protein VEK06_03245 [Myxococcota bacterium]|nr:hypothetical protein [Myxococcota bacterium]